MKQLAFVGEQASEAMPLHVCAAVMAAKAEIATKM